MGYVSTEPFFKNVAGQRISLTSTMSSNLIDNREKLLRGALHHEQRPTHALFLDCDMVFPPDLLHSLIQRQKDIVGVNYAAKIIPSNPTAVAEDGSTYVYTDSHSTGIEKVGHVGFGAVLLTLNAIRDIPEPWFAMPWMEEFKQPMAEDIFFCKMMRENGIDIYVDHDVSRKVEHQGMFNYTHAYMGSTVGVTGPSNLK
jgi:hypothetical protein